jgi:hypothetical protein
MSFGVIVARVVMLAVTVGACRWLTSALGPWKAIGAWALGMAVICAGVALWLDRQPPEQITFVNRLAGYLLPWGYDIGRGKLIPIVITSWIVWVLLGGGAVFTIGVLARGGRAGELSAEVPSHTTLLTVLLYLAWVIDGAVLMRLVSVSWVRQNPMPPSVIMVMLALTAMILGSAAIKMLGKSAAATKLALAISGGPPLVVGLGYGVFLLVALTMGGHTRWN